MDYCAIKASFLLSCNTRADVADRWYTPLWHQSVACRRRFDELDLICLPRLPRYRTADITGGILTYGRLRRRTASNAMAKVIGTSPATFWIAVIKTELLASGHTCGRVEAAWCRFVQRYRRFGDIYVGHRVRLSRPAN